MVNLFALNKVFSKCYYVDCSRCNHTDAAMFCILTLIIDTIEFFILINSIKFCTSNIAKRNDSYYELIYINYNIYVAE